MNLFTGLQQKRVYTSLGSFCPQCVHQILLLSIVLLLKWDPMRTPPFTGVRIGSHLNRNAFMHEHTTIGIHDEEVHVPKLVYTLFCCKPVFW